MLLILRGLWRARRGATAIENSRIAALIAVAIIGGLTQVGNSVNNSYDEIAEKLPG